MTEAIANPGWERFQKYFVRYEDLGFSLDISRMQFDEAFLQSMEPQCARAFEAMQKLEAGEIANPDENRMVGHYWLRAAALAPTPELQKQITDEIADIVNFAAEVHSGKIASAGGAPFSHLLLVGIGGSALGPQLVSDALTGPDAPMDVTFFDNTDPDGMDRDLARIGDRLSETLTLVISKSGGTKETRNGMLEAEHAYRRAGLDFARHAVAVTGPGSKLDNHAEGQGWIRRFPMSDWIGGRTSVMSVVGLLPAALQGVDIEAFLAGAGAMDAKTRALPTAENAAMLLALMWHHAGNGKGEKDMVVLPYKDCLVLFSKYLQQLVMESLGKELDLDGKTVHQGIAVYGNKGSTDQHAYVQQLRDGVNNFFAVFLEIRRGREGESMEVEEGAATGDYLQGFLRGTRTALTGNRRESITISVPEVNATTLGQLIALFERAVTFYASLVHINAYHQPGVEAGKKAAGDFLTLLNEVRARLAASGGTARTAGEIAGDLGADPEQVFHALNHIAANDDSATRAPGDSPAKDVFQVA